MQMLGVRVSWTCIPLIPLVLWMMGCGSRGPVLDDPWFRSDGSSSDSFSDVALDVLEREAGLSDAAVGDVWMGDERILDAPEPHRGDGGDAGDDVSLRMGDASDGGAGEDDVAQAMDGGVDGSDDAGLDGWVSQQDAFDAPLPSCRLESASSGLGGGSVGIVEVDPSDPTGQLVYLASGRRLYRSMDGGDSWEYLFELEANPRALAFDSSTLLLGTNDGLFASSDGGRTWVLRSLSGLSVTKIATTPALPRRVYAAVAGVGMLRSNDGGRSWSVINRGIPPSVIEVGAIFPDPENPNVVLITTRRANMYGGGSEEGDILRSMDGGNHWSIVSSTVGRPYDAFRCKTNPQVMYFVSGANLFASVDGGASVVRRSRIDGFLPWAVVGLGEGCERLVLFSVPLMGFGYRLDISTDGGNSFSGPFIDGFEMTPSARSQPTFRSLGGERILAGTVSGLFVSENGGRSYRAVGDFLSLPFTVIARSEGVLWAGTYGSGLWVLEPNRSEWIRISPRLLPNDYVFGLFPMDGANATEGHVLVGSWGYLYARRPGEMEFVVVPTGGGSTDNVFAFTRLRDGTILFAAQTDSVQRSENGGLSFELSNSGMTPWPTPLWPMTDVRSIASNDQLPALVLVGGEHGGGLWRSTDSGRTWVRSGFAGESVRHLIYSTTLGVFTFSVEGRGIFETVDGVDWTPISAGLDSLDVTAIEVDVDGSRYAVAGGLVYRLAPGGRRWELLLPGCNLNDARLIRVVERMDGRWLYISRAFDGFVRFRLDL
ncbi:MAG: hypothetical protein RMJ84_12365 [Sandaracinaceae bacterium]|nr:hypothetical protein [Sandaracinaceae bacterium]